MPSEVHDNKRSSFDIDDQIGKLQNNSLYRDGIHRRTQLQPSMTPLIHEKADRLHTICWTPDGDQLLASSSDGNIYFYNFRSDSRLTVNELWQSQNADHLKWRPDDRNVFAVGIGRTVKIFDRRKRNKQRPINQFTVKNSDIIDLNWHPNGQFICAGTKDNRFETFPLKYAVESKPHLFSPIYFNDEINEFKWDYTGRLLLLTTGLGTILIYDWNEFHNANKSEDDGFLYSLNVSASNCICISCDQQLPRFAVGCANSLLFLFDIPELICSKTFSTLDYPVRTVNFSSDGAFLASACENRQIAIFDVNRDDDCFEVKLDSSSKDQGMPCLSWHPVSPLLAYTANSNESEKDVMKNIAFWMHKKE
ncbi:hypothetical protein GJ496_011725 [Pomphorhynchus laevis]|nr:hypothetical protein GJ496_011725 [Pomphorhynchus laevis]